MKRPHYILSDPFWRILIQSTDSVKYVVSQKCDKFLPTSAASFQSCDLSLHILLYFTHTVGDKGSLQLPIPFFSQKCLLFHHPSQTLFCHLVYTNSLLFTVLLEFIISCEGQILQPFISRYNKPRVLDSESPTEDSERKREERTNYQLQED